MFAMQVYHVKVTRPDGSIGWQGGPDLALSAEFTEEFCDAVRDCWLKPDDVPNDSKKRSKAKRGLGPKQQKKHRQSKKKEKAHPLA